MTDARGVKYYVKYSLGQYEGPYMKEFPIDDAGKRAIESFLNEYAGNPDFKCQVIWGHEIEIERVEIVKQFRVRF